jgi:glycerophosphoryl diester phosphodiesterase
MPEVTDPTTAGAVRRALRRVGHKGADHIAPGNTLASFDAALACGVDMIEFDVLPERRGGRLVLAHDLEALRRGDAPTLEEGLAHVAADPFAAVELDVDLKLPGYEREVVDALRRHGLVERTLISTQYVESLDMVAGLEPRIRRGWSVPKLRHDPTRRLITKVPAIGALAIYREWLPRHMAGAIAGGRVHAVMAEYRLITRRLVQAVQRAGGELYAWTVDDLAAIRKLEALGVDGVISNDPRLFHQLG